MDYHRYSSIGVGSVPPLLTGPSTLGGNGLPDHSGPPGAGPPPPPQPPPPIPGAPSSLLAPHHTSLMFHYGVGGKPHSVPPHLLPTASVVSAVASSIGSTNCITNSINKNGTSSTTLLSSKASGSGIGRTTATVPPLGLNSSLTAHTTTTGSSRSTSPNSSFAAALRSLAKQATGPPGSDAENSAGDPNSRTPPKTTQSSLPSTSTGPCVSVASAPPIVTLAPTHAHLSLPEMRKPGEGFPEMDRVAPEDIVRGFQPYRAPDIPTASAASAVSQAPLRPTLPLDLAHAYPPYPSLYSHHLSHQYRLEEQLYLERYGLLRPPLAPYGVGGLSALYPTSPYLAARFPPELLPTSIAALHPSSALLHERLKLEEDIRQREYELELRRERELEREREKERERGREREREKEKEREREREKEKEREKRHKEYHENEKLKEERLKSIESTRDRSPLSHAASGLWNSATSSGSTTTSSLVKKGLTAGTVSQLPTRTLESRTSKISSDTVHHGSSSQLLNSRDSTVIKFDSSASRSNGGVKHRSPAIVRPFETTTISTPVSASPSFVTAATMPSLSIEEPEITEKKTEIKVSHVEKRPNLTDESPAQTDTCKPFTVWQPVQLNSTSSSPDVTPSKTQAPPPLPLIISSVPVPVPVPVPVTYNEGILPPHSLPLATSDVNYSKTYAIQPVSNTILQTSQSSKSNHSSSQSSLASHPVSVSHPPPLFPENIHPYSPHVTQTTQILPPPQPSPVPQSSTVAHVRSGPEWRSFLSPVPHSTPSSPSTQQSLGSLDTPVPPRSQPSPAPTDNSVSIISGPHISTASQATTESFPTFQAPQVPLCVSAVPEKPLETPPQKESPVVESSLPLEQSQSPPIPVEVLSSPEKPATPVSRLDTEEQRLRELRAMGMLAAEAEETLLEEALSPTKTPGVLCIKGPPNPLDASSEKLSFLCSFGLTTHDRADEMELGRYERRAKVLTPLSSSPRKDPTSPNGCVSGGKLAPMLAPGQNLPESCKVKSSSLLVDFSNKSRFLHHLDLQPQHSLAKQKEVERIWKLIIEERLRRYCQNDSDDPLAHKISCALRKLLEVQLPTPPSSPLTSSRKVSEIAESSSSVPSTSSAPTSSDSKSLPPASCIQTFAPTSVSHSVGTLLLVQQLQDPNTTSSSIWGLPISNTSVTSSSQIRSSCLKVGMKGLLEDGILGIENYLPSDHDPLAGLSGFEKMIDHFVKNAQADGNDNSRLLEHIEEVRRCQMSVCQSAQIVQDQVAKLISSRSQLESHRAALHHHLSSISNILASKNTHQNSAGPPTTTTTSSGDIPSSTPTTSASAVSPQKTVSNNSTSVSNYVVSLSSFHPPLYSMSTIQSSLQSGTSSTNIFSTVNQQPFPANPQGTSSVNSTLPIPALVPLTTKGVQSALPAATVVSWAGISPPFIAGTNIPLSLEGKDAIFYPNLISRDQSTQPSTTQLQLKINPKLNTFTVSTNAGSLKSSSSTSSRNSGSIKGVTVKPHNTYLQGQLTSKFNGSTASLSQRNVFKPSQQTGTSGSGSSPKSGSNLNVITCNTFPTAVGTLGLPYGGSQPSQLNLAPSSAGSNPTSSSAFLSPKGSSSPYANHSSTSKSHKSSKSTVGFTPYSKSSPNKLQTWFPN